MEQFTVIGMTFWGQRVAEVVSAETSAEAEHLISDLVDRIAGVLAGAQLVDLEQVYDKPRPYTVVAYYSDNDQRYGADVEACSAAEAEDLAVIKCNEDNGTEADDEDFDTEIIVICGVVEGDHQCVDVYAGGEGSIWERPNEEDELWESKQRGLPLERGPQPAPGPRSRPSALAEGS